MRGDFLKNPPAGRVRRPKNIRVAAAACRHVSRIFAFNPRASSVNPLASAAVLIAPASAARRCAMARLADCISGRGQSASGSVKPVSRWLETALSRAGLMAARRRGDFAFIAAGNHQPKRLLFLAEVFLDGVERGVGLAVARFHRVGARIHFGPAERQDDGAKQNQCAGDGENQFCAQRIQRLRRLAFPLQRTVEGRAGPFDRETAAAKTP